MKQTCKSPLDRYLGRLSLLLYTFSLYLFRTHTQTDKSDHTNEILRSCSPNKDNHFNEQKEIGQKDHENPTHSTEN